MKRKFNLSILIVIFIFLIGCNMNALTIEIPDELAYAKDFMIQLQKNDVNVKDVKRSLYEGYFEENDKAAFIVTDKGSVDVIFFATSKDQNVKIETSIEKENGTKYKYSIQGKPLIESSKELYFSANDTFMSITDSKNLDTAIKKAFDIEEKNTPIP